MRHWFVIGLFVLLVGCGGETVGVPPTDLPPTATPIALTAIDLAPILIADGDLPADYDLRTPSTKLQNTYLQLGVPDPAAALTQTYDNPAEMDGLATIFLYDERPLLDDAYRRMSVGLLTDEQPLGDLGEQAMQSTAPLNQTDQVSVVFVRCRAVVIMEGYAFPILNAPLLMAWAKKVDQRIQESPICATPPAPAAEGAATPVVPPAAAAPAHRGADLAPILFQADLPVDYRASNLGVTRELYEELGIPVPDSTLTYGVELPQAMSGFAAIWVYADEDVRAAASTQLIDYMKEYSATTTLDDLGEQALRQSPATNEPHQERLLFQRCDAIVLLKADDATHDDGLRLSIWARGIDERIQMSPLCLRPAGAAAAPGATAEPTPRFTLPDKRNIALIWQDDIPGLIGTASSGISMLLGGSETTEVLLYDGGLVGTISVTFFADAAAAQHSVEVYARILSERRPDGALPTLAVGDLGYIDETPNPRLVAFFARCTTATMIELDPAYADELRPLATAINARITAQCTPAVTVTP
jgi:hypothetical protein